MQAVAYSHGIRNEQIFLSTCLLELKSKEQEKVRSMALSALKAKPLLAAPNLVLWRLSEMCFDDDEAINYYKKVLNACPDCIITYDLLAERLRRNTSCHGCLEIVTKGPLKLSGQNSSSPKLVN